MALTQQQQPPNPNQPFDPESLFSQFEKAQIEQNQLIDSWLPDIGNGISKSFEDTLLSSGGNERKRKDGVGSGSGTFLHGWDGSRPARLGLGAKPKSNSHLSGLQTDSQLRSKLVPHSRGRGTAGADYNSTTTNVNGIKRPRGGNGGGGDDDDEEEEESRSKAVKTSSKNKFWATTNSYLTKSNGIKKNVSDGNGGNAAGKIVNGIVHTNEGEVMGLERGVESDMEIYGGTMTGDGSGDLRIDKIKKDDNDHDDGGESGNDDDDDWEDEGPEFGGIQASDAQQKSKNHYRQEPFSGKGKSSSKKGKSKSKGNHRPKTTFGSSPPPPPFRSQSQNQSQTPMNSQSPSLAFSSFPSSLPARPPDSLSMSPNLPLPESQKSHNRKASFTTNDQSFHGSPTPRENRNARGGRGGGGGLHRGSKRTSFAQASETSYPHSSPHSRSQSNASFDFNHNNNNNWGTQSQFPLLSHHHHHPARKSKFLGSEDMRIQAGDGIEELEPYHQHLQHTQPHTQLQSHQNPDPNPSHNYNYNYNPNNPNHGGGYNQNSYQPPPQPPPQAQSQPPYQQQQPMHTNHPLPPPPFDFHLTQNQPPPLGRIDYPPPSLPPNGFQPPPWNPPPPQQQQQPQPQMPPPPSVPFSLPPPLPPHQQGGGGDGMVDYGFNHSGPSGGGGGGYDYDYDYENDHEYEYEYEYKTGEGYDYPNSNPNHISHHGGGYHGSDEGRRSGGGGRRREGRGGRGGRGRGRGKGGRGGRGRGRGGDRGGGGGGGGGWRGN